MNKLSPAKKRGVCILGSTGSIGKQALEVIKQNKELFSVEVLTAGRNADLLIKQALEFEPNCVVITEESLYQKVKEALYDKDIKVFTGERSLEEVVSMDGVHMVLTAMVGYSGLKPTVAAIRHGKHIALANKETLVVAGDLITSMAAENRVDILPVDSEHSAIFQCLVGEFHNPIEKIYLTASGGPFRGKKRDELQNVLPAQALKHPNWSMGAKITIDSASLMNKGLEVIEAKWLFGLSPEQIDVVVHPQSIIHSIVQFNDGSMKAQMGLPDMKLPIQYALAFPNRIISSFPRFNFLNYPELTFEKPDKETFVNLALAYEALDSGGNKACILNAANEVAVQAFLEEKIGFLDIALINSTCMEKVSFLEKPSLEDYIDTDKETRLFAESFVSKIKAGR